MYRRNFPLTIKNTLDPGLSELCVPNVKSWNCERVVVPKDLWWRSAEENGSSDPSSRPLKESCWEEQSFDDVRAHEGPGSNGIKSHRDSKTSLEDEHRDPASDILHVVRSMISSPAFEKSSMFPVLIIKFWYINFRYRLFSLLTPAPILCKLFHPFFTIFRSCAKAIWLLLSDASGKRACDPSMAPELVLTSFQGCGCSASAH